ncbi:MAG: ABC transporter permease [Cytophagales bacterium]|nr:MAG: ABC transporter permease [Cytophagales bacterium]
MNQNWWKILTVLLLLYTCIAGFLFTTPRLPILNESIRNLYFHVPMWFGMILILTASVVYSVLYLRNQKPIEDIRASQAAQVGVFWGILGLLTGMIWAHYTWGKAWSNDVKQTSSAIALLIYLAYFILRDTIKDEQKKAGISAVYNIYAYAAMIPLLFILPRLTDSLHPGNGGNPGFNAYDLDSNMRLVFYPAILAWTLLGWWIFTIKVRYIKVKNYLISKN